VSALSDTILAVIMEEPTPTTNEGAEVLAEKIAAAVDPAPDETEDGSRIIDYEILRCERVAIKTFGMPEEDE
jgi:hypothetical protein